MAWVCGQSFKRSPCAAAVGGGHSFVANIELSLEFSVETTNESKTHRSHGLIYMEGQENGGGSRGESCAVACTALAGGPTYPQHGLLITVESSSPLFRLQNRL